MDEKPIINTSPVQNKVRDETKDKFDALLKEALNSKRRKNIKNIATRKPSLEVNSLTSSNENLQNKSTDYEEHKSVEVVKVDVHENSGHNYILNKFLNDSSKRSSDEVIAIDVNDPDVIFIKPPVPRPRRRKQALLSSPSVSSVGTYNVTSPKTSNIDIYSPKTESNAQLKVSNAKDYETGDKISSNSAEMPTTHKDSPAERSPNSHLSSTKISVADEIDPTVANINNTPTPSEDLLVLELETKLKGKIDKINYENEVRGKSTKKRSKKSEENKNPFKDVVETLMEDQNRSKYTYASIIGITIHKTDRLKLDSMVIHPVVKVHIVNAETGEYLPKSDTTRTVVFFYENKNIKYITPIISDPFNLYEKHSLYPAWEETLIINEDINYMLNSENKCILFFEIMDFVSFSVANSQLHQRDASRGWHKIAWAFLKPLGKNNELNTGKKVRLQLYYPNKHKKVLPHICPIFHWWCNKKLVKYPSSLYVNVKGIKPPEKVIESLRSKTPIQGERGSRTDFDSDMLGHAVRKPSINKCNKDEDENEVILEEFGYKSFKLPNKCVAELPSYDEGCLMANFSKSGLYLACSVLIKDVYSIVVYSVKSYEEVRRYTGHQGLIYSIKWSEDDQFIITASADCTVCIWNIAKNNFVEMLPHPSYVYATEISTTNLIATGCYDNTVRLWCYKTTKPYDLVQELEGHNGYVTSLCFNSKSTCLYSADSVGVIIEWKNNTDNDTWSLIREIKLVDLRQTIINQILLHPRERKLLIHARDSTLRLIDLKTGYVLHWLQGAINNRCSTTCSFSSCSNYVFAGGENGLVNVWKTDTGESVATYSPYDGFHYQNLIVNCVVYHPQDNILAISHYGHNLPILLAVYDGNLHGKSNIGLRMLQHEEETKTHRKKLRKTKEKCNPTTVKMNIEETDNVQKTTKGKLKFEDVIEKIDELIISQSSTSNSSKNSVNNLLN